ncbi:Retrovirus-related Pol polyprotein from transposon TNT 1-94 [Vitis vinifera]|uniref:Retrovirus-related Pol polyprotein from transposon TNT 1-94 n=1 Tax=Vitis vinifera TaxID=29760 RepID=A0A438KF25_VITVI|nr:Retrovirus-related Pol polyprotein from transposon TNT 1-94 [Vitis vinifera]
MSYGKEESHPTHTYECGDVLLKWQFSPPKKVKIGPKTIDCIFIGYAHNSNAYRFLVYESNIPDIHKNTIMESRNASFFEDVFPCKSKEEPSSSKRMLESEPQTFKEAVNSTEGLMWKEAIKSEIDSILQNHTWELVNLPPGCKPLSSKWIFKRKMKVDGSIDKYKARLVIKGYRQTEGLDYFDTYSPVTRINSIRMVFAIAALRNLEIHQMDVKTAFLNGDLDEEIYMEQPEGFSAPGQEKKVCKLVKSLYGLKQAPKQWHEKFDNVMLSHGFKINECDKCVYVKDTEHGYVIVCLYVDDMLIVGSDDKMITSTKNMLNSRFDMKDMGLADVILGIKIKRTSDELILSQSHYVDKILGKFDKDNSGVARTPVDVTLHLSKNKGESVSQVEYSRVIGSLMYLMSCTRPDIAYAVSKLSRYTSNPGAKHWQGIIRVLKYLRFTRDYGLHYTRYPAVLEGYSDANWISNVKDSKSHSGYVFTLGGAAVSWKSSKKWLLPDPQWNLNL